MTSPRQMNDGNPARAQRVADEKIYDNADFFDVPKEYFELIYGEIQNRLGAPESLLDIGCANGAFLHHAGRLFPDAKRQGLEPVALLADRAAQSLPNADVFQGGLFDDIPGVHAAQAVTMMSVNGIFDDPAQVVRRLLSLCSPNGLVFLFSPFNEEPIDVILSYRRVHRAASGNLGTTCSA